MVGPFFCRPDAEVPVERARHGLALGGQVEALRPDGPVGPAVHLIHIANGARLYPLRNAAAPVERITLVAHLGSHAVLLGQLGRSEEHTSELQSLMRISYAVFCLKKKNNT